VIQLRNVNWIPMKHAPIVLAALLAFFIAPLRAADAPVYELRIYVCNEGKLPDLLKRFRDHTVKLFEKHGMTNIGYWVPTKKEDGSETTLVYLLKHASRDAAKASFAAFGKDPEWQAARKASEENGKILAQPPESTFLTTTDYSPEVVVAAKDPERTFELRIYETAEGKVGPLNERFRNHTMKLFSKYGMEHIGYWEPTDADKKAGSKLIYLLAHSSEEAGLKSFTEFRADPEWIAAKTASEEKNGGSLTIPQPNGVRSVYLKPVDFSAMR
jgi:NIPSNAP